MGPGCPMVEPDVKPSVSPALTVWVFAEVPGARG